MCVLSDLISFEEDDMRIHTLIVKLQDEYVTQWVSFVLAGVNTSGQVHLQN